MGFNNVPLEFIMTQAELNTKGQSWTDSLPLDSLIYLVDKKKILYLKEVNGTKYWYKVGE